MADKATVNSKDIDQGSSSRSQVRPEQDTGFGDQDISNASDSSLLNNTTSPKAAADDKVSLLIESFNNWKKESKRFEEKLENAVEKMERTMHQFQLSNIEERVILENKITKKINEKTSANLKKIDNLETRIQVVAEKADNEIAHCNSKITACEETLRNEATGNFELLKSKVKESHKINQDRIVELEHRHESFKIGIEADVRRIRNRSIAPGGGSNFTSIIARQIKLPTYSGKSWEKPANYIREIEEYFEFVGADEDVGLQLLGQSLGNDAKDWWIARRDSIRSWDAFKSRFLTRFWGEKVQRDIRKDIEFGYYIPESRVTWSEYAARKFAAATGLTPPIAEQEVVRNLIRHFEDYVLEAARCRNIKDIDALLAFLDEVQSGGRSNAPKYQNPHFATNRHYPTSRVADDRPRQTSWRANNNTSHNLSQTNGSKSTVTRDDTHNAPETHDNKKKAHSHEQNQSRQSNWTTSRVNAIAEEVIDDEINEVVTVTEN